MAQQSVPLGTWDEDPDGASILLATGRARHDLLVIAEPAFLRDLDQVWGRPSARVRLSFLPGVHAPSAPGQEDALMSYERGGLGVLVARGRTSLYEGESVRSTTALARIASGARLRAALLSRYALFRRFGKDALLLTVLSYNVGTGTLLGGRNRPKSRLIRKLERGDRNILPEYLSFCRYKGRVLPGLLKRRRVEFALFYIP